MPAKTSLSLTMASHLPGNTRKIELDLRDAGTNTTPAGTYFYALLFVLRFTKQSIYIAPRVRMHKVNGTTQAPVRLHHAAHLRRDTNTLLLKGNHISGLNHSCPSAHVLDVLQGCVGVQWVRSVSHFRNADFLLGQLFRAAGVLVKNDSQLPS